MRWIIYDSSVELNDFEKVHSGGSSDSYILLSLADPNLYMGVKREDFFKSLLSKRTDELLFSARALVARMKEELVTRPEGPVTGVPAGIDVNKPPKNFRDAMSREDRQSGRKRRITVNHIFVQGSVVWPLALQLKSR